VPIKGSTLITKYKKDTTCIPNKEEDVLEYFQMINSKNTRDRAIDNG
jgi:hypothetical protein